MEEVFEKMLPIFRKAANTPEQISREEKNVLQYRLSPQKGDAAIKARTSSESFEDLVRKCLTDGGVSTLTDDELKILSQELAGGLKQTRLTTFFNRIKDDEATVPRGIDRTFFISVDDAVLRASVNAVDLLIILHDAGADAGPATASQHFPGYSGVTVYNSSCYSFLGLRTIATT